MNVQSLSVTPERRWAKAILLTAATYNVLWGLLAVFLPLRLMSWLLAGAETAPFAMQIIGVVTLSMGLAYLLAAFDPFRQWVVPVAGLVFSVLATVAYFAGRTNGITDAAFFNVVLGNWIIWIPLLGLVVWFIYRQSYKADDLLIETIAGGDYPLDLFDTTSGENLLELSQEQPVLLVFLRHFGCVFCKDTLDHVSKVHKDFERCGTRIVLVHMVSENEAKEHLDVFGLSHLTQISDPESMLYKRFRLRKGRIGELFGFKALSTALRLYVQRGFKVGPEAGDSLQMPGVFLLEDGRVKAGFMHQSAADQPDYDRLLAACCS
jgi:peroxiredoxin